MYVKATTICGENGGCDSPEHKKNAKKFTFSHFLQEKLNQLKAKPLTRKVLLKLRRKIGIVLKPIKIYHQISERRSK
ncbi:MAG TPA: hypothetical protein DD424_09205 [Porphyromonadaceae bacterium]|nr:hypothetical protein [Porphyromonadaceae bacterium]